MISPVRTGSYGLFVVSANAAVARQDGLLRRFVVSADRPDGRYQNVINACSGGSGVKRVPLVLGPLLGGIGQDFQHFSRLMPFF